MHNDLTQARSAPEAPPPTGMLTLIPTNHECVEGRAIAGWSVEDLAREACVSTGALLAYERRNDHAAVTGPGLLRIRQAFEKIGINFWYDGTHQVVRRDARPYDLAADLAMITASYGRFGDLHAQRQMASC